MASWEEVEATLQDSLVNLKSSVTQVEVNIETFRSEMVAKIEDAKKSEILAELKKVNARLDAVERRLTPDEPDTVASDDAGLRRTR